MLIASMLTAYTVFASEQNPEEPRKATSTEVFKVVTDHFQPYCGQPSRCSMTIDARGACPITALLISPEPLGEGSKEFATKAGTFVHMAWICLSKSGKILEVQFTDKSPWSRS